MRSSNSTIIIVVVALIAVVCCVGVAVAGIGGASLLLINRSASNQPTVEYSTVGTPNPVATLVRPAEATKVPGPPATAVPGVTAQATEPVVRPTVSSGAQDTLKTLEEAEVPIADLRDLAERLKGIHDIPETLPPPAAPYQTGAKQKFWASNVDTNENFQVDGTLQYVSDHLYFWVQDGVRFNSQGLKQLGDTFEQKIYPTDRQFFGSEWTPGIDSDPHLYILLARGLGGSIAGYYSSADEYDPKAHPYSNSHEMFMLNADTVNLADNFTYGVLAHEFQHMIHWYRDRNEESWINEGFSEVAAFLNGYDVGGFDYAYMSDPDIQLNDWPNDPNNPDVDVPHYGAGFLFLTYFLDRFGDKATQALVGDAKNGLVSVDDALSAEGLKDPQTGEPVTADHVFADWAVTNYLLDPTVGDGRFTYKNYPSAPKAEDTESFNRCPLDTQTRDVHQYGVDYIRLNCKGDYTLNFTGSTEVGVLSTGANSGSYAFWSNFGNESDMTLTQSFDFTGKSGPLTLKYSAWYDLEKDYDYVYVEAREPGGDWKILQPPHSTDTSNNNPSGNAYGPGYTGVSNNWLQDQVDISAYAGKKVELRFEYVTDANVYGDGFMLDDVSIPETGYQTDFETDDGGWQAAGFVRIENKLPQTYSVSLILKGGQTTVQNIELTPDQVASIPLHISGDVNEAVLVVSGTTRFTRQLASYEISVQK